MQNVTVLKDIEFIRETLKLSVDTFCKKTSISRMTYYRWQKNEAEISKPYLEKIYSFAYEKGIRINEVKAQTYIDMCNSNEKIVFHGAKKPIDGKLDLDHSKENNDFGKAFYAGEDLQQSASFVANSDNARVYICKYTKKKNIKSLEYNVDEKWMLTIAYFRKRLEMYKESRIVKSLINKLKNVDLVIAPIADNQMYTILDEFINGNITNFQCEKSMSVTNLGKQYCFRTNKALEELNVVSECYLCEQEKKEYLVKKAESNNIGLQKVKYIKREYAGKGKYIEDLL